MFTLAPLPPLKAHPGLEKATADHLVDMQNSGITGHEGSDESHVRERIFKYAHWKRKVGENIKFAKNNARDIVLAWIIDDNGGGGRNKENRKNLLDPGNFELIEKKITILLYLFYSYLCMLLCSFAIRGCCNRPTREIRTRVRRKLRS